LERTLEEDNLPSKKRKTVAAGQGLQQWRPCELIGNSRNYHEIKKRASSCAEIAKKTKKKRNAIGEGRKGLNASSKKKHGHV